MRLSYRLAFSRDDQKIHLCYLKCSHYNIIRGIKEELGLRNGVGCLRGVCLLFWCFFFRASAVTSMDEIGSRTVKPPDTHLVSLVSPCPSIMHACRKVFKLCSVSLDEGDTVASILSNELEIEKFNRTNNYCITFVRRELSEGRL